jgi:type IV pilus assembly protein PilC
MPEFIARIGTPDGAIFERTFNSDSERSLRAELQQQYLILGIKKKSAITGLLPGFGQRRGVKMKEFLLFNQELASLLKAGLPILSSLDILTERRKNVVFKRALLEVKDKVRGGMSLSEAFAEQGELFPKIYCSTLASGERSGEVSAVLQRYIGYQKTLMATKRKVLSALIYPACLFLMSIAVIVILITMVVPKFVDFYGDLGADLPLITRLLIGLSSLITHYILLLLAGIVGLVMAFRAWQRTEAGKLALDRFKLRIPLVGMILHKLAASRFVRTLGTLLAGGIPAVSALGISGRAVGNLEFERQLIEVERKVREGSSLWQALDATGLFSDLAIEMTKVGESTGALSDMLINVSEFYDEEIDTSLSTIMALLEPAMLVFMGMIVAMMLLAIYLPLLRSYSQSGA